MVSDNFQFDAIDRYKNVKKMERRKICFSPPIENGNTEIECDSDEAKEPHVSKRRFIVKTT